MKTEHASRQWRILLLMGVLLVTGGMAGCKKAKTCASTCTAAETCCGTCKTAIQFDNDTFYDADGNFLPDVAKDAYITLMKYHGYPVFPGVKEKLWVSDYGTGQFTKLGLGANLHDRELISVHEDAGVSGSSIDHRPGVRAALDEACHRRGALVVHSLSRLARSTRDTLLIADVGESSWEAFYLGIPGADYGWPCVEGSHPLVACDPAPAPGSLTDPIFEYHHGNLTPPVQGAAAISGPVYPADQYPESFHHRRFFADHEGKWIRHAFVEPDGTWSV